MESPVLASNTLVFMMMMIVMFRVPAGDTVVLTVMMMIAMLRVPAGDPVVLIVMMMIASHALVFITPIGVGMLGVLGVLCA